MTGKNAFVATMLDQGIAQLSLTLDPHQRDQLLEYVAQLHRWNGSYNLTAVRSPEQMLVRHVLDSLVLLPQLPPRPCQILDLGCGAGLPGLILAICQPLVTVQLVDSVGKKIRFVRHIIRTLKLENAHAHHTRSDDYDDPLVDIVVARAVASVPELCTLASPLLKKSGTLWAMVAAAPDGDASLALPGFEVQQVVPLTVPLLNEPRHLVVLKKL